MITKEQLSEAELIIMCREFASKVLNGESVSKVYSCGANENPKTCLAVEPYIGCIGCEWLEQE